jgi:DNA-binding GntR family transcriptional regulator
VRDLSPEQVEQIYSVRLMLETTAAQALPLPMSETQLAKLVGIQEQHAQAVDHVDLQAIFECNNLFHRTMYESCGNQYLVDLIEQMARRALIVRFHPYADRSFLQQMRDEHWAMIGAIRACDRERLVALICEHVPRAKQRYLNTYDERVARMGGPRPAMKLSRPGE